MGGKENCRSQNATHGTSRGEGRCLKGWNLFAGVSWGWNHGILVRGVSRGWNLPRDGAETEGNRTLSGGRLRDGTWGDISGGWNLPGGGI